MLHNYARARGESMATVSLQRDIARLGPWFHNLHLPDGSQTAPEHFLGDFPRYKWDALRQHLPEDLLGRTVLDIGCNAGFYSIQLAQRGARVLGIDHDEHYLRQARWATKVFDVQDRVELRSMQVYDLAQLNGRFDVILFMGVFYHLRYPTLALDLVAEKLQGMLVFQTLMLSEEDVCDTNINPTLDERDVLLQQGWPRMSLVEGRMANDPTNWWVPNRAAVEAMLRMAGLRIDQRPERELYICSPVGTTYSDRNQGNPEELLSATGRNRIK